MSAPPPSRRVHTGKTPRKARTNAWLSSVRPPRASQEYQGAQAMGQQQPPRAVAETGCSTAKAGVQQRGIGTARRAPIGAALHAGRYYRRRLARVEKGENSRARRRGEF